MRVAAPIILPIMLACALLASGCGRDELSEAERETIASLQLSRLGAAPASEGNLHADDPDAASLGEALFFDTGLSSDGTVSCATCHDPVNQFQDGLALGQGLGTTDRRTMPLAGIAHETWLTWDGRKDSIWSQALEPLETAVEHGSNRVALVRHVATRHAEGYEALFGPQPSLADLPQNASPRGDDGEREAWADLDQQARMQIDIAFANMGKALEAFIRSIDHHETRFDRFAAAIVSGVEPAPADRFDSLELEGLRLFIGKANCIDCHNGPRFTDGHFHNTGVPDVAGLAPDRGRAQAVGPLLADPFSCLGDFSDAADGGCAELRFMQRDAPEFERAFKTPSLRGAATRPPYMHAGQFATLEEVIDHYSAAPEAPSGQNELQGVIFTERGRTALIAFLRTLD